MPKQGYQHREPTHDWQQVRPLLKDPAQITYEIIRPVILWGETPKTNDQADPGNWPKTDPLSSVPAVGGDCILDVFMTLLPLCSSCCLYVLSLSLWPAPTRPWSRRDHNRSQSALSTARQNVPPGRHR